MKTAVAITLLLVGSLLAFNVQHTAKIAGNAGQRSRAIAGHATSCVIVVWCAWCMYWLLEH